MSDEWFNRYPGLRFERRDNGVLWMFLDRPEVFNATDGPMHLGLSRVWLDINDDPETRVVVVTGTGDAFSAGGDLNWISGFVGDHDAAQDILVEATDLVHRMLACRKVIISAINGVAVGAGLAVALMADISLIGEDVKLTDGHMNIGVGAGDHAVLLWPLLCGMARAKYYLLTADFIDGKTAGEIGLVSKALPSEELLAEAERVANKLGRGPQHAIRGTKRALNLWLSQSTPAFEASAALEIMNFLSADAAEGVNAMREKRRPDFA